MPSNVKTFIGFCILCLSTVKWEIGSNLFRPAVYGPSPNNLLQFGYIKIAEVGWGEKYVLILRDDYFNYYWFYTCSEPSIKHAARAIIYWSAAFRTTLQLMPDGSTYFKNKVLCIVAKGLRVSHHFTLPYFPRGNRTFR